MLGLINTVNIHLSGTLAADQSGVIRVPLAGCTLAEVAVTGSNANDAKLTVGTVDDPDAYLKSAAIGDSSAFVVFNASNFDGALADANKLSAPHLAKNAVLAWALDFDGASGAAAANVDLQFTFLEG